MERLKKYSPIVNIQIAVAFAISIYLADLLNLENSVTAGVVTLLSVQITKKQTLETAAKRVAGFILMLVLVVIIFNTLGYELYAFGLFVLIFALLNSRFNISIGLAPNVVMAGHFYTAQTTSLDFIINESLIYGIGVGMAILINLLIPLTKNTEEERVSIDNTVRKRLSLISNLLDGKYFISGNETSRDKYIEYIEEEIAKDDKIVDLYEENTIEKLENDLFNNSVYSYEYLLMRKSQLSYLNRIFTVAKLLDSELDQAKDIAGYLREINSDFHEDNNVKYLLERGSQLLEEFRSGRLPDTRNEFENRALLYTIMADIRSFLYKKYEFINVLDGGNDEN